MSDNPTNEQGPSGQSPSAKKTPRILQGPGGYLPPLVSTSVTSAPFALGGTDAGSPVDSRPPLEAESGSPFAHGPVTYTTRPPWMVSQPAPGASLDSGPCFVQGADIRTPFAPSELPSTIGFTRAPFGSAPPAAGASAAPFGTPPGVGQTAAPFGSPAPAAFPAPIDDKDAWYNKAPTYSSRRRGERGVGLKLFLLLVKLLPAAMVLYGGYYGYQQFFGELSEEELAAYYGNTTAAGATGSQGAPGTAGPTSGVGGAEGGEAPKSRVGIMLQQAKDSIAAHDQNVHMANAIADNSSNLDDIQASLDNLAASDPAPAAGPPQPARVQLAFDDAAGGVGPSAAVQALTNFSGPMSTLGQAEGGSTPTTASVAIAAPELSTVEPSLEFRAWVSRISVSGVRGGTDPRAFVSGRLVRPGMIVDHRLGIHFSHIDEAQRLLLFEDSAGAVLGKRY